MTRYHLTKFETILVGVNEKNTRDRCDIILTLGILQEVNSSRQGNYMVAGIS